MCVSIYIYIGKIWLKTFLNTYFVKMYAIFQCAYLFFQYFEYYFLKLHCRAKIKVGRSLNHYNP